MTQTNEMAKTPTAPPQAAAPAVPVSSGGGDLALPGREEWQLLLAQANKLIESGLLPDEVDTPEKGVAIILKGRELGLPPMTALSELYVVRGKVQASTQLMLAMCYSRIPDFRFDVLEIGPQGATVEAARPGQDPVRRTFTIQDAERAGLTENAIWRKYPETMCYNRATSQVLKIVAADVLLGCSTRDELEEAMASSQTRGRPSRDNGRDVDVEEVEPFRYRPGDQEKDDEEKEADPSHRDPDEPATGDALHGVLQECAMQEVDPGRLARAMGLGDHPEFFYLAFGRGGGEDPIGDEERRVIREWATNDEGLGLDGQRVARLAKEHGLLADDATVRVLRKFARTLWAKVHTMADVDQLRQKVLGGGQ